MKKIGQFAANAAINPLTALVAAYAVIALAAKMLGWTEV